MEKYMKFTMFEKETKDMKYQENPYRATNFTSDSEGRKMLSESKKQYNHKT